MSSEEFLEEQVETTSVDATDILYIVRNPLTTPADHYILRDNFLQGYLKLSGGSMTGAIAMGTNKITGLGDPTLAQDAATKAYVDAKPLGHTIKEEGTGLTQRAGLNFIGALVTATDDAVGDETDVTLAIPNDHVTYAMIQNVSATDMILGRDTTGAGDIEELTPAAVKTMLAIVEADITNLGTAAALVADKLSVFAATTSAELAGVISDETGTGLLVFGTSPTLTTPVVSGAISFPDGVRQTFNPDGTTPGLNVGSQAGDPSTPSNGDLFYNSTTNALRARINAAWVSLGAGGAAGAYTMLVPMVMEVPNDTVAYPDIFALGDASSKMSGFWLPNSGTSAIVFKCIVPEDLHGTPAAKVVLYMLPRTTVANSTVNLTLSRTYVNTTEDVNVALTAEAAVDVELTSTADFLTIYEYDVTAEPTAGELFHGTLTRTPGAANDDFTEDLFIVAMVLKIEVQTV